MEEHAVRTCPFCLKERGDKEKTMDLLIDAGVWSCSICMQDIPYDPSDNDPSIEWYYI